MFKSNNKLQALVFSLGLAALMLPSTTLSAQTGGGLFGRGESVKSYDQGSRGLTNVATTNNIVNQGFGDNGGTIVTNQSFGEVPVSNGLFILAVAGAGYAIKKRRKQLTKYDKK